MAVGDREVTVGDRELVAVGDPELVAVGDREVVAEGAPKQVTVGDEPFLPFSLLAELNQKRKAGEDCDVSLQVGETAFKAHRKVLAAASPYFKAMFSDSWSEGRVEEVILREVDAETVKDMLDYIYTDGTVPISRSNAEQLLFVSHMYQVKDIQQQCSTFLDSNLSTANCVRIFSIADTLACEKLRETSSMFLKRNFIEVLKFGELTTLSLPLLVEIISSDDLNVIDEETSFQAVAQWLKFDPERKSVVCQLLKHVRFPLISPKFLHDCVSHHDAIKDCPNCRALVEEALWYRVLPNPKQFETTRSKPRISYAKSNDKIELSVRFVSSLDYLDIYDSTQQKWLKYYMTRKYPDCTGYAITELNGVMYAAGGTSDNSIFKSFFSYDEVNDWQILAPMLRSRTNFTLLPAGDCLYAVGGDVANCFERSNTIERYWISQNKWTMVVPCRMVTNSV